MTRIYYCLIIIIFTACVHADRQNISIPNFEKEKWQQDSLGCLGLRKEMSKILNDNTNIIVGHTQNELFELLGSPNCKSQEGDVIIVCYFVDGGRQCFDTTWKKNKYYDAEQINFHINRNEKVIGTTGVIYP